MANFSAVSSEVYTILRSFDYMLDLYDEKSNKVYEPDQARKFFASKTSHGKTQNLLVAVDDLNSSSTIQLNTGPSSDSVALTGLWETLKTCATKYNMIYSLVTHKKEIHPKNFASGATMNEGMKMTDLTENMYGTSRSSYLRIGEAKMIVRHNKRIDAEAPGSRSRCVESIFIENAQGERHLLPSNDLAAGRAMGQHVNQGGSWADPVAQQINNMSGYFSDLGASASYLGGAGAICEGAEDLRAKCRSKRKSIRESFNRMFREATYAAESARFAKMGDTPLLEGEGLERLREQLTVEGRKLPESVVKACSRLMAESDEPEDGMLDEQAPEADTEEDDAEAPAETSITLMGHTISRDVFDRFNKDGELELKGTPDLSRVPPFQKVTDELMYKLSEVAMLVKDDAMGNFLSSIANMWEQGQFGKNPARDNLLIRMAGVALKAAGVSAPTTMKESLGPRGVTAILEMEAWFASFDPDRVLLAEGDCSRDQKDCDDDITDAEDALDDCNDEVRELKKKLKDEKVDESADLDEDLTQEDILLPKNQGLDLELEVVSGKENDPEMARMLTLAGRPVREDTENYSVVPSENGEQFEIIDKRTRKKVGMGYATKGEADNSANFKQSRLHEDTANYSVVPSEDKSQFEIIDKRTRKKVGMGYATKGEADNSAKFKQSRLN